MTMGDKKSPTRPKRQAKPVADEGFWDCSVCTFRNSAEAFKCSICDVRKGTSTRKPRINSQLVAQQVAQQYATPPPPKKEKKEKVEKQEEKKTDKEKEVSQSVIKKNTNKKTKPKSDIVKDPPSEANSIQSGNTTKTSDSNHTSRDTSLPKQRNRMTTGKQKSSGSMKDLCLPARFLFVFPCGNLIGSTFPSLPFPSIRQV
ncbi:RING1 and YY1-binding protein isoform X2 [Pantherophis guttatus]|uniref:RING1 and YY1-binding protein isoform X2 n=1 Tax=Pantherophis guttatus TaxID=94885 RepID=A0A6P9DL12_PANGU|nr:RING1 and YY1-binding protein isoform X2 [Pantherophis guttatus]